MNTTIDPLIPNTTMGPPGMTFGQYITLGGLYGVTITISVIGLIGTLMTFLSSQSKQFWKVAAIMSLFNVVSIIFSFLFATVLVASPGECAQHDLWVNISSHTFFFLFDSFMLFKTYATTSCNKYVLVGIVIILTHRVGWGIADVVSCEGRWDPEGLACNHYQNPTTGLGYNSADLIADVFATLTCLGFNYKAFSQKWATVIRTLIQENILRSMVIVSINSVLLWVSAHVTDPFTATVCFVVQNNVYAVALNSELYWIEARKSSGSKKATTNKSGGSGVQQKTSSAGGGARQKSIAVNEH
ncbi:hypothetical protein HDU98_002005 [Podochytrium sp. JEL0797]|nr:hypothetical protein HDU98_002005 [Podochytrium sp. JEL0797]